MVAVGLTVLAVTSLPTAARATNQLPESTECPAMTDSINRLFSAFFNRAPNGAEFLDWSMRYRSGEANLVQIAQGLAESPEFRTRYGNLSDDRYVDLVYRNVLRREPAEDDRTFWVDRLEGGLGRGSVMIAFSEAEEFVRRTDTATPLAGYLRWYPEGTHWYCGIGPRDDLPIKPLDQDSLYADYAFFNGGDAQSPAAIRTVLGTTTHLTITDGSLPAGFTSYKWGGEFSGDGNYGSALDIEAGQGTSWIAVFYPSSIGEQRLGWQIKL